MTKKIIIISSLILILNLFALINASASSTVVDVKLVSQNVTLNEQQILSEEHRTNLYPFLLYKDITYVPMTYFTCSLLGLTSHWTEHEGLVIDKRNHETLGTYYPAAYLGQSNNSPNLRARIANIKITVNGKVIDNSREEYPLLSFRDVTYFPLTWRFAVDEFSWKYSYANTTGLQITGKSAFIVHKVSSGGFSENEMWLFDDNLKVYIDVRYPGRGGPPVANMYITRDGVEQRIGEKDTSQMGDSFGYGENWNTGDILYRHENWIYTTQGTYWRVIAPRPCRVNMDTGEIVLL